jgi:hypothetical protein
MRCLGTVPAVPSFVAAEVACNRDCERAFVIVSGVLGVNGCSYRGEMHDGQWRVSVMASNGDGSGTGCSVGGGVYVGSPIVSVISHAPLAAYPPSNAAFARPHSRSVAGQELSLLTCDGSACRSTLLRASLGVQVRLSECSKILALWFHLLLPGNSIYPSTPLHRFLRQPRPRPSRRPIARWCN